MTFTREQLDADQFGDKAVSTKKKKLERKEIDISGFTSGKYMESLPSAIPHWLLQNIGRYVVLDIANPSINNYQAIQKFHSLLDRTLYRNDEDKLLLDVIHHALVARIEYNMDAQDTERYVNSMIQDPNNPGHNYNDVYREVGIKEGLTSADMINVENEVENYLKHNVIYPYFKTLRTNIDNYMAAKNMSSRDSWGETICQDIDTIHDIHHSTTFENSEARSNSTEDKKEFLNNLSKSFHNETSEGMKFKTGISYLNRYTGGGFGRKRVYVILGLQGEGKSSTLLNLAYQFRKNNPKIETSSEDRIPEILYLSLENSMDETNSRYVSIATNRRMDSFKKGYTRDKKGRKQYILDEQLLMDSIEADGGLTTEDSPVILNMQYFPPNSINTSYIKKICDDELRNGKEIVAIFVDYLNVINATNTAGLTAKEERIRLGRIMLELKAIANEYNATVVTAGQMNRAANEAIDNARMNNVIDIHTYLNRSNTGESMQILNNGDGVFMIAPVHAPNHEKWLMWKDIKSRIVKDDEVVEAGDHFYHPYMGNNSIKMYEDSKDKNPTSVLSLDKHLKEEFGEDCGRDYEDSNYLKKLVEDEKEVQVEPPPVVIPVVKDRPIMPLYDNGMAPIYDPYWRCYAPTYEGSVVPFAMCPEQQIRAHYTDGQMGDILNPGINSLNGYSRYEDKYTVLYDENGSKEERIAHDYNIRYPDQNFTKDDYNELYTHFNLLKQGQLGDAKSYKRPEMIINYKYPLFKQVDPCGTLFVQVPEIDAKAYIEQLDGKQYEYLPPTRRAGSKNLIVEEHSTGKKKSNSNSNGAKTYKNNKRNSSDDIDYVATMNDLASGSVFGDLLC